MSRDDGMDVSPSWQELKGERDQLREALDELHYACVMQSCRGADHVPTKRARQDAMSKARAALKATEES